MSVFLFFFFKQKTAYEMRISDWSSDVCSSDLATWGATEGLKTATGRERPIGRADDSFPSNHASITAAGARLARETLRYHFPRSEEHTSELQSLMRISYAVFCLQKKSHTSTPTNQHSLESQMNTPQSINIDIKPNL